MKVVIARALTPAAIMTLAQVGEGDRVVTPAPPPAPAESASCNPNYTPCIPNAPYDLDCADIGFTVQVIGYDEYRLDRGGDGYGCE